MASYGAFVSPGSEDAHEVNALLSGNYRGEANVEVNKGTNTVRRNIFLAAVLILAGITSVMYASSRGSSQTTSEHGSENALNLDSIPLMKSDAISPQFVDKSRIVRNGAFSGILLKAENEYGSTSREGNVLDYPFLKSKTLVEPYKSHTLTFSGFDQQLAVEATFKYSVIGTSSQNSGDVLSEGSLKVSGDGTASVDLYIESKGFADLKVVATLSNGEDRTYYFPLALKYVRRELTTLTDGDRERFLDAMYTIWSVSTKDGVEKFGSDYKSIFYFTQVHLDATMYPDCDQLHDGRGFVVSHLYLEAYFEQSLQAVDPRVAMHYLDYGKLFSSDSFKVHLAHSLDGGAYTELFSDKWFGSSDPQTGFLDNSRWKDFEIPLITSQFFEDNSVPTTTFWKSDLWDTVYPEGWGYHGISPLGYQRGMWSMQNNNKLTRFHQVFDVSSLNSFVTSFSSYRGVNCDYLSDFVTSYVIGNTFETMSQNIEYHAHGPAHFAFGGTGGRHAVGAVHELKTKHGWTESEIGDLSWSGHHALKNSFNRLFTNDSNTHTNRVFATTLPVMEEKFGYDWDKFNADDGAYMKSKDEYGGMVLTPAYDLIVEDANEAGISVARQWFLDYFKIVSTDTDSSFYKRFYSRVDSGEIEDDEVAAMNNLLATSQQWEGDISSNGAPLDPVFWMLHGEVFRLLHRVYFEGGLSDSSFTTVNSACEGHSAMGTNGWLEGYHFSNAGASSTLSVEKLSNRDLASYLDPLSYDFNDKFDFVYDEAKYDWCPAFNEAFDEFASAQSKKSADTGTDWTKSTEGGM